MVKPLDDIRVVSLGQIYQGGYCTLLLSYMGAEVIKVEPPWGENLRARSADGQPPNFQFLNASKKSVTLDIKSDAGQKAILELVEDSDVFVQNYRPGKLEKLGLGYEDLKAVNPEIVYAHGSGYGDSGPYADRPAMDLTIQAISGIVDATGFPEEKPVKAGPAIGDFLGAVHLTVGILGALRARDRTGEGEYVDVGMMDCLYPTLASQMAKIARDDDIPSRTGNQHPGGTLAPYNVYEVADGYVAIICVTDAQWERLATVMDRPDVLDDDRFATKIERGKNREAVNEVIREWIHDKEKATVTELLLERDVPCSPVKTLEEVADDPQLEHRGMLNRQRGRGDEEFEIGVPGLPIKYRHLDDPDVEPAPLLGEDNDEVLGELDLSEAELRDATTSSR